MTLGGAAQLATAHCPYERTLDAAVCSYNKPTYRYAPASRTMTFTPQCSPATTHFLVASITQYDRLLASSCCPSVCLLRCVLWPGSVYRAKSCTSVFLEGMFLFVPSDTFAVVGCIV